jgi:hypothetical protein
LVEPHSTARFTKRALVEMKERERFFQVKRKTSRAARPFPASFDFRFSSFAVRLSIFVFRSSIFVFRP